MPIRWRDWGTLLLGAWLLASPWQLEFTLNHAATANACGLGVVLVVFNLISVARLMEQGQEIVNILAGTWLLLSPYSLDFAQERTPAIDAMAVGAAIICLSLWQFVDAVRRGK